MGAGSLTKICELDGCESVVRARKMCSTHYNQAVYGSARHRKAAQCELCGRDYEAQRKGQRFCSLLCRSGGVFAMGETTEDERRMWREARRRRRAIMRGIEVEDFTDREIYDRDGWRCRISGCGKRVRQELRWPHPMSASLDHIVPLTVAGASHTRRNVRLAHLVCNTRRGNRIGTEQLALIG